MDPTILHHHSLGPAIGAVGPWDAMFHGKARLASLRHRVGLGLYRWGYRHPDGVRVVAGRRVRGRLPAQGVDSRGKGLRIGPGVAIHHFDKTTSFTVGEDVSLYDHVQVRLEAPGAHVAIGDRTWVNERSEIIAHQHISIGADCAISWDVLIMDSDGHRVGADTDRSAPIHIGDRVWIGARATVLKGVTVGEGAVLAAGAVVTADVPPRTLVAGVPARAVRSDVEWEV